ncbi:auxin-induced protein X15-like [Punica granatum]|nr:auxin-induced protein X15-like [Punica granatum]
MIGRLLKKFGSNRSNNVYTRLSGTDKPVRARKGYIVIYVGPEAERYEIPVMYLSFPEFKELITRESAEEDALDIKITGPLHLKCSPMVFKGVVQHIKDVCALFGPRVVVPYYTYMQ